MDSDRRENIVSWAHSRVPALRDPKAFISFLLERKLAILLALAAIIVLFFFWNYIKVMLVMAFFIVIGGFSMIYNRWLKLSLGVEFVMLGLVICSIAFGRLPGLIVGLLGLLTAEIVSERFTYSTFVSFVGIGVVAMIAPNIFHQTNSITTTGIILTVIYDAVIIPGYLLLGSNAGRTALFAVTHVIFNVWVFSYLAPAFLKILGA